MGKLADELLPKFADHPRSARLSDFKRGTLAWVIQRGIEDIEANPVLPQIGRTKLGRLRLIQKRDVAQKPAAKLTRHDIQDDIKARRKDVGPATANHDLTCISTMVKHYADTWEDLDLNATLAALASAKRTLSKKGLIGKANRRTRRPTDDEIARIMAALVEHDKTARVNDRVADFVAFGLASSRRRGEVCRITWGDVNFEKQFYWVRDLKHPTKKKGNDKRFLLWPELATIIKRQPRLRPDDPTERIFPFNGNSIGAIYCEIKNALGIQDLRLHDNRGEATSKWIQKIGRDKTRKIVTGHDSEKAFDIYDRRTTEDIMQADETVQRFLRPQEQHAPAR